MLIFMLQAIWQFISDFAGKDVELLVIGKFLLYYLPYQVPLLLPLTILVASIMTFGNFAENYEFAAMKSAGISLQRAMKSLIIFIVILGYATFTFANTVIPWSEFKAINLKNNITKLKPAMAIVEGVFTEIGEYNIKVIKKSGDNNQYLHDVIIHRKDAKSVGNYTVIKANDGELFSEENSNTLQLILFNGNYYDEIIPKTYQERQRLPFVKSSFEEYTINIDMSDFNNVDLDDESVKHPYRMLNVSELRVQVDSFSRVINKSNVRFNNLLKQRTGFSKISQKDSPFTNQNDSVENKRKIPSALKDSISQLVESMDINEIKNDQPKGISMSKTNTIVDSITLDSTATKLISSKYSLGSEIKDTSDLTQRKSIAEDPSMELKAQKERKRSPDQDFSKETSMDSILQVFPDREIAQIFSRALSTVNSIQPQIENQNFSMRNSNLLINKTEITMHKKYALAIACIILFFVGAPLGAIIRKGGMGLPLIFAIVLFLIYHFIGIFAENAAETGKISPFMGAWTSTFIMLPLGVYLTQRATTDQGFVNLDFISVPLTKLLIKLKLNKYKTRE
jgi:lipopolysaccharide export system permease protein